MVRKILWVYMKDWFLAAGQEILHVHSTNPDTTDKLSTVDVGCDILVSYWWSLLTVDFAHDL